MKIDEAIAGQISLIKASAQGLSDKAILMKNDASAMSEAFTLASLNGCLREMLLDRADGKTEW